MFEEQKSNTGVYIAVVILFVVGGVFSYWYFMQEPEPQPGTSGGTSSGGTLPGTSGVGSTGSIPVPSGDIIYIKALTGESVPVKDFTKNPILQTELGIVVSLNDDYTLIHYKNDGSFLIAIKNADIQAARDRAESDFLSILGISKAQACILRVSLSVPRDINEMAAGQDYHLSFCPNGKSFFRF